MNKVKQEPVLTWSTVHMIVNILQITLINVPAWVHVAILVVSAVSTAMMARQQVTPTTNLPPSSSQV